MSVLSIRVDTHKSVGDLIPLLYWCPPCGDARARSQTIPVLVACIDPNYRCNCAFGRHRSLGQALGSNK